MINKILQRRAVRHYQNKPIEPEKIELLKRAINSSATSMNAQCFSTIFITDPEIKKQFGISNWNQPHILEAPLFVVFIADLNRVNIASQKYGVDLSSWEEGLEGFLVSVVDAAIGATTLVNSASLLNLGTCYIGGVRTYTKLIIETLGLPKKTFPILGVVVGYEKHDANIEIKPKVNKIFDNSYDFDILKTELEVYNKTLRDFYFLRKEKDLETANENDYYKNTNRMINAVIIKKHYDGNKSILNSQGFLKDLD